MFYIKKISCLLFFSCLLLKLHGQRDIDQVQVKIYEFEEGLSHRDVYHINQDAYGFLWIATANGLNRFDSKNFFHLNKDPLLATNNIKELQFGSNHQLWLSLPNRLIQFDTEQLQSRLTFTNDTALKQGNSTTKLQRGHSFNSLFVDDQNLLWTCSYNSGTGLSHLLHTGDEGVLQQVLPCKGTFEKRALAKWNNNIILSYDENTLLEISQNGKTRNSYTLADLQSPDATSWITQLQNVGDSTLWALSNTGQIYYLKKGTLQFREHPLSKTIEHQTLYNAFSVMENGDIWVAGRNALWWYHADTKRVFDFTQNIRDFVKHSINFRQVFEDQTGVIWVASDFGLIKLTFSNPLFTTYLADGHEHCYDGTCSIRGITEDDQGNIYFSYYNSIHRLDQKNNTLTPLFENTRFHNPPFGLLYHQNALWTGNGLRIDLKDETVDTLFSMPATDLGHVMLDQEGDLWFGYRNRIFTYNTKNKKLTERRQLAAALDTSTLDISFLYQSPSDLSIWIGTLYSGLFRIDKYKGLLEHYDSNGDNGLPFLHNKINGIYEDRNQQVWIATGNGLHQLDMVNHQLSVYLPAHGLAHSFINGLLSEGDSVLWISTDNGLSRFSMASRHCLNFKKADGLSANEFNRVSYFKASDGRMYFGGLQGINSFYPSQQFLHQKERREGKMLLTQFSKLDGEKDSLLSFDSGIQDGDPIGISWQDKLFTFQFALANFDNPGAHQFSYKLEGYEKKLVRCFSQ